MPYISKLQRDVLDPVLEPLLDRVGLSLANAGDINYIISRLVDQWVVQRGLNYNNCNAGMGIFAAAQAEFYRRRVAPYEDEAMERNGDVFISSKLPENVG